MVREDNSLLLVSPDNSPNYSTLKRVKIYTHFCLHGHGQLVLLVKLYYKSYWQLKTHYALTLIKLGVGAALRHRYIRYWQLVL